MNRLKDISFFSKLDEKDLKLLSQMSSVKTYSKGKILFYEGESPKYLHVLLDGVLKLYKTNFKSQQIFLHQFHAVSFVAELANFENIPYPATSEFVVGGSVLKIDYEKFKSTLLRSPDLSFKIIRSLSEKLKIMSEVLHKEVILTWEAKVAKFIVELPELFGELKHIKIAQLLNITPETLSRTLSKFKQQKLIELDENQFLTYCDAEKLQELYE